VLIAGKVSEILTHLKSVDLRCLLWALRQAMAIPPRTTTTATR